MVDGQAGGTAGWVWGCGADQRDRQGAEVVHGFRRDEKDFTDRVKFKREPKSHRTKRDQILDFVGFPNQPEIC